MTEEMRAAYVLALEQTRVAQRWLDETQSALWNVLDAIDDGTPWEGYVPLAQQALGTVAVELAQVGVWLARQPAEV